MLRGNTGNRNRRNFVSFPAWAFIVYLAFLAISVLLYLPKFAQLLYAFHTPPLKCAREKRRIGIVVPARDESRVIGDLLRSISQQDYDPACFDVNVIVKDANDPTVHMARRVGAKIFIVENQSCKGDALDGFFRSLAPETLASYDAFVIVDADAVLSPNFISRLNCALEYDRDVFVTRKNIKNFLGDRRMRTLVTDCSALVYPIVDELGNLYRAEKDIPLNLCGQGLMLRRRVIEELGGWPYRTLTEDFELKMDSFLKGFSSTYYPHAVLYTEEATSHRDSFTRRVRWLAGFTQCGKLYKQAVKRKLRADHAGLLKQFEFRFSLLSPAIFLVATLLSVLLGAGAAIYYAATGDPLRAPALVLLCLLPIGILYFLLFLYSALAMLVYRDALESLPLREKLATLLVMPLFLLEFVPVYLKSRALVRKKRLVWKQPERHELAGRRRAEDA